MKHKDAGMALASAEGQMRRAVDAARAEGYQAGLAVAERALYEGEDALFALLRPASALNVSGEQ